MWQISFDDFLSYLRVPPVLERRRPNVMLVTRLVPQVGEVPRGPQHPKPLLASSLNYRPPLFICFQGFLVYQLS